QPAAANHRAIPRPMPTAAPVTRARCPCNPRSTAMQANVTGARSARSGTSQPRRTTMSVGRVDPGGSGTMSEETPQPEGEPSPTAPEETPTAGTKPFTYDDAVAQTGDEDDVAPAPPPGAEAPTQATPVAPAAAPVAPTAAATTTTTADRPAGIFIPKWLGIVAAAIV